MKENEESDKLDEENYSSDGESNQINHNQLENINELYNKKSFLNYNNSCSFTSFLSIFIFAINPAITKEYNNNIIIENIIYNKNKLNELKFELYLKFINEIKNSMDDQYIDFYTIYEKFNLANNCNLFNLLDNEYKQFVPSVINYRPLINNKIFSIIYNIKYFCTGFCKYRNGFEEFLISSPFIDVPLIAYEDNNINTIEKLLKEYIYINLNTICNLESCYDPNDDTITNFFIKKYEINEVPLILSINTNINEFSTLLQKKDFINKVFKYNISLYHKNYKLISLVTAPTQNHFISYYKCLNEN